jgi:electron transport complex protein RnfG
MKGGLKMFVVLTSIALISGGLLSALDSYTAQQIAENRQRTLKNAIADVLPAYDYYDEFKSGSATIYIGMSGTTKQPVGLAFRVIGSGFQGKITMMVGITPDFTTLMGIKVLEQVETPGLGTKIAEDPSQKTNRFWFPDQFKGLVLQPEIMLVKNRKPAKNNEIEAITGATISSKAVVRILNDQIQEFKKAYPQH